MADYGTLDGHAQAIMDLLYAQAGLTVYPEEDGGATTVPPNTPPPYVVVQIIGGAKDGQMLSTRSTRMSVRAYCQCVGATDVTARRVADLVQTALLDVRPTVDGRTCYPIRLDVDRDPLSSDTTGTTTVTITNVYRLDSEPGTDGS